MRRGGGGEFRGPGVQFGGSPGFQAALGWFGVPPQAVQGSSGWGGVGRGGSGPPPLCVAWGPHRCFGVSLSPPHPPHMGLSVPTASMGGSPGPCKAVQVGPRGGSPHTLFLGCTHLFSYSTPPRPWCSRTGRWGGAGGAPPGRGGRWGRAAAPAPAPAAAGSSASSRRPRRRWGPPPPPLCLGGAPKKK